ncbi:hypothetical protein [Cellulomonas fengjieae]|uniref:Uncharacterized protein n=1 Tax=Cellulomonas fengjieae TaxID=2819978 RepID=A0ABS3SGH9_9CELL|nr:hypothetical protein [Cellulomonas fengjieae]MBO3084868.1 hypothetical protein [Cellulomonas fengjieae]MBO3103833.1 hypothetical protein [Cellulomonas fengjieae]QVI66818.1 hypothetical protein KG102_04315 [Cellulomonas fengjieae]
MSAGSRGAREQAAYGRALALDDGDLVLDAGRLEEVGGVACLRQGLELRLATPWASDRLDVRYGLDVRDTFTAALPRPMVKDVLRLSIIRSLAGDPRVASVDRVLFDDDPEYLAAHPGTDGGAGDVRTALVEITVTPVPLAADLTDPASDPTTGAAATVQVLADVRW